MTPGSEFRRKITKQHSLDDGCEEITLECGHMLIMVIPGFERTEMECAQCIHEYLERRAK
jgi:hypothetical protein